MSYKIWQNAIYALILIAVIAVCFSLAPKPNDLPHGIFLSTGSSYAPISPEQVNLYNNALPDNATQIGTIRIAMHYTGDTHDAQASARTVFDYAQRLAAHYGANGVNITTFGVGDQGPLEAIVLYGQAVHTP